MRQRSLRRLACGASLGLLGLASSAWSGLGQTVESPPTLGVASSSVPAAAGAPGDVVLAVPYVAQTEALCGGAAVAMTLRYWGDPGVRAERFASLLTPDGRGIRTDDLRRAVANMGWTALPLAGDAALLHRQLARGRPLIALLEVGRDRYHYVTVVGHVGGRVVFHDPAVSPYRSMPEDRFLEAWSGAGRWAVLVLPGPGARSNPGGRTAPASPERVRSRVPAPPGSAVGVGDGRATPGDPGVSEAADGNAEDAPCAAAVERAVRLARAGALAEADRTLRGAARACPGDARPPRELAALRLRQGRPTEALGLARTAVARDSTDRHARELLAASHYLAGDEEAALAEWNGLGAAIVEEVTLGAPTRTRNRPILALSGIEPGRPLSPEALAVGRRRLELLPAAASTRLSFRPGADGRVTVTAAVSERPAVPTPERLVVEGALGVLTDRGIRLRSASPFGYGELWSAAWRWQETRRRIALSVALPVRGPVPGVVTLGGAAARETYRFGADAEELAEDRRRAGASAETWATPWLRVSIEAAFDRWLERGSFGSLGGETRFTGLDDRLALTLDGAVWLAAGDAPGFAGGGARLDWASGGARRGLVWSARVGARGVTADAPRSVWPGAGAGTARGVPARGHRLLSDGRIAGPLFGRRLLHGGLEAVRWTALGPFDAGLAAFLDLAASGARPPGIEGASVHADAGLGLRLGLPGAGALRLDLGRGLVDGRTAVSVGLEAEPPR